MEDQYNKNRNPGYYWVVWNRRYGKIIATYRGSGWWQVGSRSLREEDLPYIGETEIKMPDKLSYNPFYDKESWNAGR